MRNTLLFGLLILLTVSCAENEQQHISEEEKAQQKIPIIIDTDANNELDDQHALAYSFFNRTTFDIKGITANATFNGGEIDEHLKEAQRVMQLCNVWNEIPLKKGANKDFDSIKKQLHEAEYDGAEAVEFIIKEALNVNIGKLVLVPVGKLTNIALAIHKAPEIKDKIRIVWLGSNYPEKGEYNLINDISAMNYILEQNVPFEMVMVRYGKPSGSDAVRVTPEQIIQNVKGLGTEVAPITGRHGGTFTTFGDYSANLFTGIDLYGDPPSRALFDLVALAILKNPNWGESKMIPAPTMTDSVWVERPENQREIMIWENFESQAIIDDFYESLKRMN